MPVQPQIRFLERTSPSARNRADLCPHYDSKSGDLRAWLWYDYCFHSGLLLLTRLKGRHTDRGTLFIRWILLEDRSLMS